MPMPSGPLPKVTVVPDETCGSTRPNTMHPSAMQPSAISRTHDWLSLVAQSRATLHIRTGSGHSGSRCAHRRRVLGTHSTLLHQPGIIGQRRDRRCFRFRGQCPLGLQFGVAKLNLLQQPAAADKTRQPAGVTTSMRRRCHRVAAGAEIEVVSAGYRSPFLAISDTQPPGNRMRVLEREVAPLSNDSIRSLTSSASMT